MVVLYGSGRDLWGGGGLKGGRGLCYLGGSRSLGGFGG